MSGAADTIYAPATGAGRAGVAIIRISGGAAGAALAALTGRQQWLPRRATRVRLRDRHSAALDDALALWFPAPASFTGEDVAELHVHGGRAVSAAVLGALAGVAGLRPAEPGEFSRRAFRNGKLDLTQAEALADLVAAETAAQHRQALRQLDGALGRLYDGWRRRMVAAMALLAAEIDFADEDDVPSDLPHRVHDEAAALRREVEAHLADGRRGERIREGLSVVLTGCPNVGKSSLLNALAGRDAAIVDGSPGTTRDILEVPMDIGGLPVVLADTAGLRAAAGTVEQEGVRRARQRAAAADLRILVLDGALWPEIDAEARAMLDDDGLIVINKSDLGRVTGEQRINGRRALPVSALLGHGLDALVTEIGRCLNSRFGANAPAPTRLRHRRLLEICASALDRAEHLEESELLAEELRAAATGLGRIVGQVDVEEILDVVFREFCIGK